jgi:hypothetical protein
MFRLPFLFIITGIVSFVLFQVLSLTELSIWISDHPRNSTGWFQIHLLVLGWATMIAMGALYQLINVVLQSKIYSEKLGFVHYGFFIMGTTGLLIGFKTMQTVWIAGFATLAMIGIVLFAWNIGATLLRAKQWNMITISTASAVSYLVLTGITGMMMGLNYKFNIWGLYHEQLFGAHIWLGTIGWFGLLITGFSYKMLPMFYLAHGHPVYFEKITVIFWNVGVVVGAGSFLMNSTLWVKGLGLLFIVAALIAYNMHISQVYKHRHKPKPGGGIIWSVWSARMLLIAAVITLLLFIFNPNIADHSIIFVILGWVYLWGWVAITILAYMSKIVPFLWWTHKYGSQIGKKKIPTMAELVNDRYIHMGLAIISCSLIMLIIGLGFSQLLFISIGGSLLSITSLLYIGMIAKVFTK